ncbi:DUF6538 domain-containing protein [Bradyrhizobium algeriense]|uniref:DUF6538 domain-containing protein n=1 Tax=Bradyrhizobium algeriense TaxID=634784 RepID=UPI000D36A2D5|nr:DUF6538 domain-containing protein [Bradyrhizobium algeriense]
MAVRLFRREATYWRRRVPRALAIFQGRPHVFLSLRTTSPVMARRLGAQLDAILEDAAMLAENTDLHLTPSQIDTMLRAVVERHLTKLEKVALAAKSALGFDVDQARSDDKRALWTYALLDAQGATAVVRAVDRIRMTSDGLSEAVIEAVQRHLAMLQKNGLSSGTVNRHLTLSWSDIRVRQRSRLGELRQDRSLKSFAPRATATRAIGTKGSSCLSSAPWRSFGQPRSTTAQAGMRLENRA